MGTGQPAEPMQLPGNTAEAQQPSMPYRNAFMGGHMIGARRCCLRPQAHTRDPSTVSAYTSHVHRAGTACPSSTAALCSGCLRMSAS